MRKRTNKQHAARIQKAVTGFRIPMMEIVPLYSKLDAAIAADTTDEGLKTIVATHPRVETAG
jgi:hypothetical protein